LLIEGNLQISLGKLSRLRPPPSLPTHADADAADDNDADAVDAADDVEYTYADNSDQDQQGQEGPDRKQILKDFQAMPSVKNKLFLSAVVVFLLPAAAVAVAANPLKSFYLFSGLSLIVSRVFL
jgi:hypothetical protein